MTNCPPLAGFSGEMKTMGHAITIQYTIATRATASDLEAAVRGLIAEGWEPVGGVAVVAGPSLEPTALNHYLYQAMTRGILGD
jgi:hypothetical protein